MTDNYMTCKDTPSVSKGLYSSQCRLSPDGLGLLFKPGKGLLGHEIITAVSPMLHLTNLPRCCLIEISREINELYQQIYLKRISLVSKKKKVWCLRKSRLRLSFLWGTTLKDYCGFWLMAQWDWQCPHRTLLAPPRQRHLIFFLCIIFYQDLQTPMNSLDFSENGFFYYYYQDLLTESTCRFSK